MADQAHFHLEQQLPELKDLLERGIFSKDEINSIVKKRTKFEYKLKRRQSEKTDYVAYINYEKDLEKQRSDRVQSLSIKGRHSVSDHSIVQHICQLYKRATTKFKGDVDLWLEYIDFLKTSNSKIAMDRALASALALHPMEPLFWIKAATWEYEGKGNISVARALFQKSIRFNPCSVVIWKSFFGLELDFALSLIERRQILGIGQDKESTASVVTIPAVVFKHSLKNLDLNKEILCQFFDCLENRDGLHELKNLMTNFIKTDPRYESRPEIQAYLLSLKVITESASADFDDSLSSILKEFSATFSDINSTASASAAIHFLAGLLDNESLPLNIRIALQDKIDQIFQFCQDLNLLDAELFKQWITMSSKFGIPVNDITSAALLKYPSNDEIRYLFLLQAIKEQTEIRALMPEILKLSTFNESFWNTFLDLLKVQNDCCSVIGEIFSNFSSNLLEQIDISCVLKNVALSQGIETVRKLFLDLTERSLVTNVIYKTWISTELSLPTHDKIQITSLFKKWSLMDSRNQDVWLSYANFALQSGDLELLSSVYKNALKSIADPEMFIQSYESLLSNYSE